MEVELAQLNTQSIQIECTDDTRKFMPRDEKVHEVEQANEKSVKKAGAEVGSVHGEFSNNLQDVIPSALDSFNYYSEARDAWNEFEAVMVGSARASPLPFLANGTFDDIHMRS